MQAKAIVSVARLRELFHYDPLTGVFTRKVAVGWSPKQLVGAIPGNKHKTSGYVQMCVDGRMYWAHRLAWFYVYGVWPPHDLDHKDTIQDHNWIDNLRPATRAENKQNRIGAQRNNKSGFLGVSWHSQNRNWRAVIKSNGKFKHIGCYNTPEEAYAAYLVAKAELHPFQTLVGARRESMSG